MSSILTLTLNPAVDVGAQVAAVVPEAKLRLDNVRREPGGGGVNVARAIRQLGGEACAMFPAGGGWGRRLVELLREEGVPTSPLAIAGETRESLSVSETSSDRQFRFVMPGPTLSREEWEACLEALRRRDPPEILVFSGSLPPGVPDDLAARVVRLGREIGSRVVVDTSKGALEQAVGAGAFLVKPNLAEFLSLAGERGDHTDESLVATGRRLLAGGESEVLAVSLGTAGALLITRRRALRFASPVVPIRSRVGAGDSMVAGIALSLSRGDSLEQAVQFGVAAGAAAVMTPGSELCRRGDTERLFAELRHQPPIPVDPDARGAA